MAVSTIDQLRREISADLKENAAANLDNLIELLKAKAKPCTQPKI